MFDHFDTLLKRLKEQFENTSDLIGGKKHAGYLHWYRLGNMLGMKWWQSMVSIGSSSRKCQHTLARTRTFHLCHMFSGWTCSHLWKAHGASGRASNTGVLWRMPIELHSAGQWAQGVRPSDHPHEDCFWLFVQRHSHFRPARGHFIGLWHRSPCSSLNKGGDTGPARPFPALSD